MNDLIEFLTSKEIIVVYIVFGIACLLCFLVYLLDKSYYKRRRKQNTKELNKLVEQVNEKINNTTNGTTLPTNQVVNAVSLESSEVKAESIPVVVSSEVLDNTANVAKNVVAEVNIPEEIKTVNNDINTFQKVDAVVHQEEKIENLVLESMPEDNNIIEEEHVAENTLTPSNEKTEDLIYLPIEPDQTEAQAELQKLTEELQKAEEVTSNISLTSFEEQQEQEAIISLDELLRKSHEMYQENEISQYADEGNEPISIADLEKRYKEEKVNAISTSEEPEFILEPVEVLTVENSQSIEFVQEKLVLEDFSSIKAPVDIPMETTKVSSWSEEKKFKNSPVISPIYGIESREIKTEMELENTANYEKLDEEIKKTNEFIMTLKELQKKLN